MIRKEHRKYWMLVGAELDLRAIETKINGMEHLLTEDAQSAYAISGKEKKLLKEQYTAMRDYACALKKRIKLLKGL